MLTGLSFVACVAWVWAFMLAVYSGMSIAHDQGNIDKIAAHWNENVLLWGSYPEKVSLYDKKGYIKVDAAYLRELHRKPSTHVQCSSHFAQTFENGTINVSDVLMPAGEYMGLLRIYYADEAEMAQIWNMEDLGRGKPNNNMISFESEYRVLSTLRDRMEDLSNDDDNSKLVRDSEGSNVRAEFMTRCVEMFATVATQFLNATEHSTYDEMLQKTKWTLKKMGIKLKPPSRKALKNKSVDPYAHNNIRVEGMRIFHKKLIHDSIANIIIRYPHLGQQEAGDTVEGLLKIYINQTIVPFLNRMNKTDAAPERADAEASVLVSLPSQYKKHDDETVHHNLLVVERRASSLALEEKDNIVLSLPGIPTKMKMKLYNSVKQMYR